MKRTIVYLLLAVMLFGVCATAQAKKEKTAKKPKKEKVEKKPKKEKAEKQDDTEILVADMYAYGYATVLNDTVIYLTEIEKMPLVKVKRRTDFLVERSTYSQQFATYLKSTGVAHPTCAIVFDRNKIKLNKKFIKMLKKIDKQKRYAVKTISAQSFTFKEIEE